MKPGELRSYRTETWRIRSCGTVSWRIEEMKPES